jgi:hypothetical protein
MLMPDTPRKESRGISGLVSTGWAEKAEISVFNPHTFGAHSETWGVCFLEIVSRPPGTLASGMPDRLAYFSSVQSAVRREMSLKKSEHCFK